MTLLTIERLAPQRALVVVLATLLLSGCVSAGGSADPQCDFPAGTRLAFQGETTLTALGLDDRGPVEAHDQLGTIYVTADEIESDRLLPEDVPSRVFCGVYGPDAEVGVVWGPVPDHWQPPAASPE